MPKRWTKKQIVSRMETISEAVDRIKPGKYGHFTDAQRLRVDRLVFGFKKLEKKLIEAEGRENS